MTDDPEENKKKYECEGCGKQFKTRSGLWKHQNKCSKFLDLVKDEPPEDDKDDPEGKPEGNNSDDNEEEGVNIFDDDEEEEEEEEENNEDTYECGSCGYESSKKFNFCPECGVFNEWD